MKKKRLPQNVIILFTDDIRVEKSEKISLIGIYSKDLILIDVPPVFIAKLCVFIKFSGGEGEYDIKVSFKDTDNNEILASSADWKVCFQSNAEKSISLIVSPLRIEKEGKYTLTVFADGKEFASESLEIKKIAQAATC